MVSHLNGFKAKVCKYKFGTSAAFITMHPIDLKIHASLDVRFLDAMSVIKNRLTSCTQSIDYVHKVYLFFTAVMASENAYP